MCINFRKLLGSIAWRQFSVAATASARRPVFSGQRQCLLALPRAPLGAPVPRAEQCPSQTVPTRRPARQRPQTSPRPAVRMLPAVQTAQRRLLPAVRPSPKTAQRRLLLRPLAITTKTDTAAFLRATKTDTALQQRRHPRAQPCPSPTVRVAVRLLRQETVRRSPKTAAAASQDRLQQRRSPRAKSSRPSTWMLPRTWRSTPPATTSRCTSGSVVLAAFGSTG